MMKRVLGRQHVGLVFICDLDGRRVRAYETLMSRTVATLIGHSWPATGRKPVQRFDRRIKSQSPSWFPELQRGRLTRDNWRVVPALASTVSCFKQRNGR